EQGEERTSLPRYAPHQPLDGGRRQFQAAPTRLPAKGLGPFPVRQGAEPVDKAAGQARDEIRQADADGRRRTRRGRQERSTRLAAAFEEVEDGTLEISVAAEALEIVEAGQAAGVDAVEHLAADTGLSHRQIGAGTSVQAGKRGGTLQQ